MIIITRPQKQAEAFAAELRALGFNSHIEPMLRIEALDFEMPPSDSYKALVFTSANAVHTSAVFLKGTDKAIYAVGPQTAQALKDLGFNDITCAHGDSQALLKSLEHAPETCLHIRGEHVAAPMGMQEVVVYTAQAVEEFSTNFTDLCRAGNIDSITFFSARTAQIFSDLMLKSGLKDALQNTKLLCLSDAVLECVRNINNAGTYISQSPDRQGMLALIKDVCTCDTNDVSQGGSQ